VGGRERCLCVNGDLMIPAPFRYVPVTSLDETISALTEYGDEAKVIAGGQSLLPLMKLRLAAPTVLLDLAGLGLRTIRTEGAGDATELVIDAMTSYRSVATSSVVREHAPLLSRAASLVGDPQVRNRGTLGGGVAHADPASDVSCALLALNARAVVVGPNGKREIRFDDLFTGFWTSIIAVDEVLTEVRIPSARGIGWSYQKFTIRSQDWALVGAATCGGRVALASMATQVIRARSTEAALAAGASIVDAAAVADEGSDPPADLRGSAAYRRHLARVLVADALNESAARRS
jgi:aerobic carbon-monoxide dehydrogenase medium subunit